MDDTLSLKIEGMDDLVDSLKKVAKKNPDRMGEILTIQAKAIRKDIVRMVKRDTDTEGSSKRSLAKIKEYKISKVQGMGTRQFVEVSGIAPHFHLLENGHQLINKNGKNIGFVVGYHWFDQARKNSQNKTPKAVELALTELLKEEGFI